MQEEKAIWEYVEDCIRYYPNRWRWGLKNNKNSIDIFNHYIVVNTVLIGIFQKVLWISQSHLQKS